MVPWCPEFGGVPLITVRVPYCFYYYPIMTARWRPKLLAKYYSSLGIQIVHRPACPGTPFHFGTKYSTSLGPMYFSSLVENKLSSLRDKVPG